MMVDSGDFRNLFVFDLANNHQGNLQHGKRIIGDLGAIVRKHEARAALKFQFRDLDTLIHPDRAEHEQNRHIPRFIGTRLSREEFAQLANEARKQGFLTMATPFDEPSVAMLEQLDIDIAKVASCSATDWPLLQRIAATDRPVIFSTGGVSIDEIDQLVEFFSLRPVPFAIMHCVSLYPTPDQQLQLNQIDMLRRRYTGVPVGFSTHERPEQMLPVAVAVAKGAEILERHVGLQAEGITLNAYSSTPELIDSWIQTAVSARAMCGSEHRGPAPQEETMALNELKRGVFTRQPITAGQEIRAGDVFFAMPWREGQLQSGDWTDGFVSAADLAPNQPLMKIATIPPERGREELVQSALRRSRHLLREAGVVFNADASIELSHHFGIEQFTRYGAVIITCINESYCKKIVLQLPGQRHPRHHHRIKDETFQVLYGSLEVEMEGHQYSLRPGDKLHIAPGAWHGFWTEFGSVFEEVSTTHLEGDSIYEDSTINQTIRSARKTQVTQYALAERS